MAIWIRFPAKAAPFIQPANEQEGPYKAGRSHPPQPIKCTAVLVPRTPVGGCSWYGDYKKECSNTFKYKK